MHQTARDGWPTVQWPQDCLSVTGEIRRPFGKCPKSHMTSLCPCWLVQPWTKAIPDRLDVRKYEQSVAVFSVEDIIFKQHQAQHSKFCSSGACGPTKALSHCHYCIVPEYSDTRSCPQCLGRIGFSFASGFACSGYFTWMVTHNKRPFVTGPFHCACCQGLSIL